MTPRAPADAPWPRVFGFHEVFHALTIVAWVCQDVAISLLAYR